MEKRHTLTLDKEFILYCELNNIKDISKIANETFNRGFSLLKYGETPSGNVTEKEKIVEVIKEVEVEKIIYQDVIKEVEVEKIVEIIKEVPVEKIVEVIREIPVEKIVEVIKEVPVEIKGDTQVVIKEVIKEIIKEVPVEVKGETQIITQEVIKEVIVEKLIEDNECKNMLITLTEANSKLKEELETLTNALNKFNKGSFMKNSDLNSLYDE